MTRRDRFGEEIEDEDEVARILRFPKPSGDGEAEGEGEVPDPEATRRFIQKARLLLVVSSDPEVSA
ncbi:MAG TPA: hypothetical protein VNG12_00115 [Acidimicrobiales bacterium]|nr:hypothetical protein [Acidimicrobiales bacterium]